MAPNYLLSKWKYHRCGILNPARDGSSRALVERQVRGSDLQAPVWRSCDPGHRQTVAGSFPSGGGGGEGGWLLRSKSGARHQECTLRESTLKNKNLSSLTGGREISAGQFFKCHFHNEISADRNHCLHTRRSLLQTHTTARQASFKNK